MGARDEQEETRPFRPWERPLNGGAAPDDYEAPSSSSGSVSNNGNANLTAQKNSVDPEYEFLRTHAPQVDETILQNLYQTEADNPRRLETILVEVLGIQNAIELILKFRNSRKLEPQPGTSRAAQEDNIKAEFMNLIQEMFPDVDNALLALRCRNFQTEDDFNRFINTVMLAGNYPKKANKSGVSPDTTNVDTPSTSHGLNENNTNNEISSSGLGDDEAAGTRKKRRYVADTADACVPTSSRASSSPPSSPGALRTCSYNLRRVNCDAIAPSKCLKWYRSNCLIRNIKKMNKQSARFSFTRHRRGYSSSSSSSVSSLSSTTTESGSDSSNESSSEAGKNQDASSNSQSVPLNEKPIISKRSRQVKSTLVNNEEVSDNSSSDSEVMVGDSSENDNYNNPTSENQQDWVLKNTEILIKLFPKTDPTYLRDQCTHFAGSVKKLNKFVAEKLEINDMPTREFYEKKMELEELRLRYTDNFSAEEYLKIIPNPWEYFGNPNRECEKYKFQSLWYLKTKFRNQYVRIMNKVLKKNNYNLYLSYNNLLKRRNSRTRPRSDADCNYEKPIEIEIPFLQEMAFIENEAILREFRDAMEAERKAKLENAKKNGNILECQCCFDGEIMAEDTIYCPSNHAFCKACVTKFVEVEIGEGKTNFSCLYSCGENITLAALQKALRPDLFSKVLKLVQMEEIRAANIENLVHCPFCNYATIMPPEITIFECLNPECLKDSCRLCKEPNHVPLKCHEVEKCAEVRMRTYIENKMTEALVRTCYRCNKMFVKEEGCNKMVCSCGAKMCYVCRKPISNYSHFNGQGGSDYTKCPLYTTNDELHVDMVRRVAEQAKAEVLQANPNVTLKYDPTKILPRRTFERPMPGINEGAGVVAGMQAIEIIPPHVARPGNNNDNDNHNNREPAARNNNNNGQAAAPNNNNNREPAARNNNNNREPAARNNNNGQAAARNNNNNREPAARNNNNGQAAARNNNNNREPAARNNNNREPAARNNNNNGQAAAPNNNRRQPAARNNRGRPAARNNRGRPAARNNRERPAARNNNRQPEAENNNHNQQPRARNHNRPRIFVPRMYLSFIPRFRV